MTGCISRFFFGLVWFLMKKPIKQAMNMQEGLLQRITTDEKTKQQILMRISQNKKHKISVFCFILSTIQSNMKMTMCFLLSNFPI